MNHRNLSVNLYFGLGSNKFSKDACHIIFYYISLLSMMMHFRFLSTRILTKFLMNCTVWFYFFKKALFISFHLLYLGIFIFFFSIHRLFDWKFLTWLSFFVAIFIWKNCLRKSRYFKSYFRLQGYKKPPF
jgi:hypothetical protein